MRERLPLAALGVPANANDNPSVLERRNENLSKGILFIMGHELGHLVHGLDAHVACRRSSGGERPASCDLAAMQRAEAAADAFAVDLFRRMGLVPSASNFFFLMSSRLTELPFEFPSDAQWQEYAKGHASAGFGADRQCRRAHQRAASGLCQCLRESRGGRRAG